MKHLMIFSIGPVQDFIATARRSRDLWYGSWTLSQLARFVAKEIAKNKDNALIFPANTDIESIPNKIMAVVQTDNPKGLAGDIKEATKKYLVNTLAIPTLNAIKSKKFNRTLAEAQLADLPELYWVSVPYKNRDYAVVREEAEAFLAARKVTRDFQQMTGANVPKSSLDGSRESVIDEDEYPNPRDSEAGKANKVRKLYDVYRARQGERLSGVDLLKRMGARKDEPDFKSTSYMAAIPFIEKLDKKWGKAKREAFIESIRQLFANTGWSIHEEDDGALLYDSRLTDWIPAGEEQNEIRKEFNQLLKDNLGDSRPSPYYALLRADGDNMGKVIDGQTDESSHRAFSEALSKFAEEVKPIVEKDNNGLLIYSGGDDVLAYLPVNKALKCASELEDAFRKSLSKFSILKNEETITPTLSIGIVIAHHLDPLSDVLQLARDAEHAAKDKVKGKNGLAITLSKRSGIDRTILGKFSDLHGRLTQLKKFFEAGLLSGGTAYELQELHRVLANAIPNAGLKAEALRIVKRKKESGGNDLSQDVKDRFEEWIGKITLDELADEMIIAKALADTVEQAEPKQEAQP